MSTMPTVFNNYLKLEPIIILPNKKKMTRNVFKLLFGQTLQMPF
jgi:hypothetical protein